MGMKVLISEVHAEDSAAIAEIHMTARRGSMPYLPQLHSDEETHEWFVRRVRDLQAAFWIARCDGQIVGYMFLYQDKLDDLYVKPGWQGRGIGSLLVAKAKSLSPQRLELSTFQQNLRARAFYEAQGFRPIGCTDGQNQEGVPDVQYEWNGP
jgi:ribosomal protein S18 acetylase RimI-like enzyme